MNNVFENVPLNNSRIYVRSEARGGCQVFLPVQHANQVDRKKNDLNEYLFSQLSEQPVPPSAA
jgi:hypothetical protein